MPVNCTTARFWDWYLMNIHSKCSCIFMKPGLVKQGGKSNGQLIFFTTSKGDVLLRK